MRAFDLRDAWYASVWRDRYLDARIFAKPHLVEELAKRIASFRAPGIT